MTKEGGKEKSQTWAKDTDSQDFVKTLVDNFCSCWGSLYTPQKGKK